MLDDSYHRLGANRRNVRPDELGDLRLRRVDAGFMRTRLD